MTFESLLSDNLIYLLCYSPHSYLQEIKPQVKEDEKVVKTIGKEETVNVESEKSKIVAVEEAESHKPVVAAKERNIDLQLDLEKTDRDSGTASVSGNNKSHFHHNVQKLQQSQHTHNEKIGKFNFFSILFIYFWVGFLWRTTCLFFGCPIGFFLFCEFWYFFYFSAQTSSLPLPMSVPGWPGGLPPMGYDRINLLCVPCSFGY